jgi:hypothetical protein
MKYLILILLLLPTGTSYAGLFDAISPSRMAVKDASEEIIKESNRLGEPFGLFGTNLLTLDVGSGQAWTHLFPEIGPARPETRKRISVFKTDPPRVGFLTLP